MNTPPELSVIIPVLDESAILPDLFHTLSRQREIRFELLLCDGGSSDGTLERARELAQCFPFPCRVLKGERGRGRQMNAGAAAAAGDFLLFLHADSDFPDSLALRRGMETLHSAMARRGDYRVAGRYALRFRGGHGPALAYAFYEAKARLDRPGCIHGDQGFLLPAPFFAEIGPFDHRLPLLEDDRLADRIRTTGQWLLLPAEVLTSARRFEVEGLRPRQTLNALLMNFAAIGWEEFFRAAPGVYRQQAGTGTLRLLPFFRLIRSLMKEMSWQERLRLWYSTGGYVRDNAWQLAFWLDVRRHWRRGHPHEISSTPVLGRYDRWLDPLTDHPPGRLAAALLTWSWFQMACRTAERSPSGSGHSAAEGG